MTNETWDALKRPTPEWFKKTKLGIFVHWGPYSVPAWAEPVAELGTIPPLEWYRHNPYAEWYMNTIRLDGSPAQQYHNEHFNNCDYDDFLDMWQAEKFDAKAVCQEFVDAGAGYVIVTTKHHDGVCLWDAPETGSRNAVHRGPKRDLVAEYADAVRAAGMRFAAYYSGGLDWHVRPTEPIGLQDSWEITERPNDREYSAYAAAHLRDLIARYSPDILWNDIDWPDEGKSFADDYGVGKVFQEYYEQVPHGLVNDRFQVPHADYLTSEYQHMLDKESGVAWENCRGLGLSFGYNQVESADHALSPCAAMKHLVDVVLRGGHLVLGVGPKADGTLPEWQSEILRHIGRWMAIGGALLDDLTPDDATNVSGEDDSWIRAGRSGDQRIVFIDGSARVASDSRLLTPEWAEFTGDRVTTEPDAPGPAIVAI